MVSDNGETAEKALSFGKNCNGNVARGSEWLSTVKALRSPVVLGGEENCIGNELYSGVWNGEGGASTRPVLKGKGNE